jgi:hypothetical protein
MPRFITLTGAWTGADGDPHEKVYIAIDKIEAIYPDRNGTRLGLTSHSNGGLRVRETPLEILTLIESLKEPTP